MSQARPDPLAELATHRAAIRGAIALLEGALQTYPPIDEPGEVLEETSVEAKALDVAVHLASHRLGKLWARAHRHPPGD